MLIRATRFSGARCTLASSAVTRGGALGDHLTLGTSCRVVARASRPSNATRRARRSRKGDRCDPWPRSAWAAIRPGRFKSGGILRRADRRRPVLAPSGGSVPHRQMRVQGLHDSDGCCYRPHRARSCRSTPVRSCSGTGGSGLRARPVGLVWSGSLSFPVGRARFPSAHAFLPSRRRRGFWHGTATRRGRRPDDSSPGGSEGRDRHLAHRCTKVRPRAAGLDVHKMSHHRRGAPGPGRGRLRRLRQGAVRGVLRGADGPAEPASCCGGIELAPPLPTRV